MRLVLSHLLIVLLCLVYVSLSWSGTIYQWTDEEGNVGFTDNLTAIPKKYRGTAVLESELPTIASKQIESAISSEGTPFPEVSPWVDDAGHDREFWQEKMRGLEQKRQTLLNKKDKMQKEADALSNPLINIRIEDRERLHTLQVEVARLDDEVKDVDKQINLVVPEEARRQNVPPGWLRAE